MAQTSISAWLIKTNSPKQIDKQLEDELIPTSQPGTNEGQTTTTSIAPTNAPPLKAPGPIVHEDDTAGNASPKQFRLKPLPLPPCASLSTITSEYIGAYMRMTALLLPIPYPKKFFEDTVEDSVTASICLIALWSQPSSGIQQNQNRKVVSGIRCRLLARSPASPQARNQAHGPDEAPSLYIAALTTLAPYRGHGLASALFQRVLSRAIREYGITTVTAHRWEANEDARGWYASHGFKEVGFASDYYRRLKPSGAFILERKIGPQDLLGEND